MNLIYGENKYYTEGCPIYFETPLSIFGVKDSLKGTCVKHLVHYNLLAFR